MEFTTSDLYEVLSSRRERERTRRAMKILIPGIVLAVVLTATLGTTGFGLSMLLFAGVFIWFCRRLRREGQADRDEAARIYAELPEDLRAEKGQGNE